MGARTLTTREPPAGQGEERAQAHENPGFDIDLSAFDLARIFIPQPANQTKFLNSGVLSKHISLRRFVRGWTRPEGDSELMSRVINFFRSLLGSRVNAATSQPSTPFRDFTRFAEGDRVLINGVKLLEPLKRGKTTEWKHSIQHDLILGKSAGRLRILSPKGAQITVEQPTFDQFVSMSPRHVTPIYASYAEFIVNQLDIHPTPPSSHSPRVEILEAGTGHGSLTLHLARAIAAANPPPPNVAYPRMPQANFATTTTREHTALAETWAQWKKTRNSVIHTVEFADVHSRAAEKLIRSFRQGLYWPHIDFNVGDVGEWVSQQMDKRSEDGLEFLSAVILDVPNVQIQLARVIPALNEDGRLVVFAASITQLCECETMIDSENLPFLQEKVLELGSGISDGRVWAVRLTIPRRSTWKAKAKTSASSSDEAQNKGDLTRDSPTEKVMICRPKVGERLQGGGFIGIWRKVTSYSPPQFNQAAASDSTLPTISDSETR